jgi:hypothetical protein
MPGASEATARKRKPLGGKREPEEQAHYNSPGDGEKSLDRTLADSFPSSDPPSSIPDPGATPPTAFSSEDEQLRGLKANTWAAISVEDQRVVGTGVTQEEATEQASAKGFGQIQLVQVPATDRTP